MNFTKKIIRFTSYGNQEGWTIDVTEDRTIGIYNPKDKLVKYKELTFSEQKEVTPLIRFVEKDLSHSFNLIIE